VVGMEGVGEITRKEGYDQAKTIISICEKTKC